MSASLKDFQQKIDEVHFLADNFGIPPRRAAALIAEGAEADDLSMRAMRDEHERHPLSDVPAPDPDRDPEHLEKDIADLEKPLAHDRSAPT